MKKLLITLILLFLSACSARDYHYAALNESTVSNKQVYHIRKLQELGAVSRPTSYDYVRANKYVCYTYPPALGGFTTGCEPKVEIN